MINKILQRAIQYLFLVAPIYYVFNGSEIMLKHIATIGYVGVIFCNVFIYGLNKKVNAQLELIKELVKIIKIGKE